VLFLDETGLMLQPLVRRTWARKGERPVMYCWDRHDRLSVIAGLTLSAQRHRIGLYFAIHRQNVKTPNSLSASWQTPGQVTQKSPAKRLRLHYFFKEQ
jgi:hypothetical protein